MLLTRTKPLASPMPPPAPGPQLRLVLLGRMEAWSLAGRAILPRGRKTRALLAILGLAAGAPVPRAAIADLLWSRRGAAQQRSSLRQSLHELQVALAGAGAPLIQAGREALSLPAGQVWVDALEVAKADSDRPGALDLLGQELLADLAGLDRAFDAWLAEQRARLRQGAAALAATLLAEARGPEATAHAARRLLAIDPGREDAGAVLAAAEAAARTPPASCPFGRPFGRAAAPPRRGARLGVLPLSVAGRAPEDHLSVGLAEQITAALACLRWLFVVDCASLATAAARYGRESAVEGMALDFLLTGSVRRLGGRVRISIRLADLRAAPPGGACSDPGCLGVEAWTETFEREATDLVALQDDIAAAVVARIDPEILLIEADRAVARGPSGGTAHERMLHALPSLHRLDRAGFLAAGEWLREAVALEPDYAPALAWRAYWLLLQLGQGWAEGREGDAAAEAEALALRAISLDPLDAQAHAILGHIEAFLHHRTAEAVALQRRALSLNPNLAMAWVFLGLAESYLGEHEAALTRLDRYDELAPCHPYAFFFAAGRATPLLLLGRHEEAVAVCRAAHALQPGFTFPLKVMLAALGHLGRDREAAIIRARLLALEPSFSVEQALSRTPVRRAEDRAHYAAGLRLGGLG